MRILIISSKISLLRNYTFYILIIRSYFFSTFQPQNLVLTADFPNCDVKLCDFGISRYLSEGADVREILGTPDYVAPEVLNYEPIDVQTDMW